MKLSAHEEYGVRCLIRLGRQGADGKLTIPEISGAEGISEAYVAKLMRMLRLGGFVTAARGPGGYKLARPASQIIVRDVMVALGGSLFEVDFCESHCGQLKTCVSSEDCSLRVLWAAVQKAVDDVLRKTTLKDLFRDEQQMITWIKGFGEFAPPKSPTPAPPTPIFQETGFQDTGAFAFSQAISEDSHVAPFCCYKPN